MKMPQKKPSVYKVVNDDDFGDDDSNDGDASDKI